MSELALVDERFSIGEIARAAHETVRGYCAGIDDPDLPAWSDAPEWMTGSAIDGVIFHGANPKAGAEASHEHWCKGKLAAGWQWGPAKDVERRLHPCLVSWAGLPAAQRVKDELFVAVVRGLLGQAKHNLVDIAEVGD